jgi:ribosomal protein S18 acetylase RimI-like enzyme
MTTINDYNGAITPEILVLLLTADPDELAVTDYCQQGKIFTINSDDQVVAVAVVTNHGLEFELINIAVAEPYQGLGIGKSLVNHAIEFARNSSAKSIIVGTGNSSLQQLGLYQKCGFRLSHVISNYFASYQPPIVENGIACLDMVVLKIDFQG